MQTAGVLPARATLCFSCAHVVAATKVGPGHTTWRSLHEKIEAWGCTMPAARRAESSRCPVCSLRGNAEHRGDGNWT